MSPLIPSLTLVLAGLTGTAEAADDGMLTAPDPFLARKVDTPVHLAHAILVKAIPDRDATITDAPEEILLTFNEGVGNDFLALAVVDGEGKRVDNHDARLDFTDRSKLRTSVSRLTPGRYMVRYRVLSADGHVVSGKYFFQVQNP
ncbi:copper resistance CopC family protein [Methylococcus capsulatus]|jgi:methionine-rich copper-binding protein CopC|uniref:Copper resistance protein C n=1 Tax=Methylococcus capsulatus (strain ATCC 33009 / NCIMB 11132 / Bath) TaxID=243233 RepID=Q605V6_METCA|nr:copper resistance CopC family protein [Methylococcus capsulatus]AAU91607.1 putative copper resistance protein [Methylococcus capsulatus str. Bath]QXP87231.1 copper resistance protein CopC [Methylococcus capsulatus]QXP93089.1 copper resistance protein CopC [Methylococcus capsulatus]UQN12227.1 copper resistance protein CopC [Methylococcus capsulatus]